MATFTTTTRTKLNWQAPATTAADADYFLDIGSGFNLLISNTHKLIIQPGRGGTAWTNENRSGPVSY